MIDLPDHIPDYRRLRILSALLLSMFVVIIGRLWYLQIMKGPELLALSETQRTRLIRRVAARGTIVDAKNRVLATSRAHYVVSVLPDEFRKHPEVLPRLARLVGLSESDLLDKISQSKRIAPFDPVPIQEDVQIDLLSQIEEQQPDLPGVLVFKDPKRAYVDNKTCSHVLGIARTISRDNLDKLKDEGYRSGDIIGTTGLEKTYERDLRGTDGGQRIEVDAKGRVRAMLEEISPVAGHTLRLTIDSDLQQTAYMALQEPLSHGHAGCAVALDPRDGAVLAFVSVPSYDLNRYGLDYKKIHESPNTPEINRVSGSSYPIGSTFKLITAAAGLETGAISPSSRIYCPGSLRVGDHVFHCDLRTGHGSLSLERAIAASCDVYFYHVGQWVRIKALAEYARRFGLGARTGIDLPTDHTGVVPTPEWKRKTHRGSWVEGDLVNLSIGQGLLDVTPLQLVDYTAALANGGTLWRPQLVREVLDLSSGKPVSLRKLQPQSRGELGLKPATRNAIVAGMEGVTESGGTANGMGIPGVSMAAKTGSAETFSHGRHVTHSIFTCFAPVENPQIAVAVFVEDAGHGATIAAPIARQIVMKYFHKH